MGAASAPGGTRSVVGVARGARELWECLVNGSAAAWQTRRQIPAFSLQGRHAAAAVETWSGWCNGRGASGRPQPGEWVQAIARSKAAAHECRNKVYTEGKQAGRSRPEWPFPLNRPL